MNLSHQVIQVAHIDAIQHLIAGGIVLFLGLLIITVSWFLWHRHPRRNTDDALVLFLLAAVVGIIGVLGSLLELANVWNWIGVCHPALYAAHLQLLNQNRPLL